MFCINTSSFAVRVTPLLSASPEFPFIESVTRRVLQPHQQVLYRRYMLDLFDEQAALVKQGLPGKVVLEEDVLSLVSLHVGEKLEILNVVEVQAPAAPKDVDRNPFRAKENVLAAVARTSFLSNADAYRMKPLVQERSRNPFREFDVGVVPAPDKHRTANFFQPAGGKENLPPNARLHPKVPVRGSPKNPFRNPTPSPQALNPFLTVNGAEASPPTYDIACLTATTLTPVLSKCRNLSVSAFDFQRRLGKGGQGAVFLVKAKGSTRHYALKVIRKDGSTSLERSAIRERDVLALNVGNRFLANMEAAFHDQTAFYIVMPLCPGGDLDSLIRVQPQQRLPLLMAQYYAAEIVFGIFALHDAKVLHRDLKLANVFIKPDGHICVGDFGLAIPFSDESTPVDKGGFCGTSTHVAPETWLGHGWTMAADWWALGVMIFHMLCGDTPWGATNPHDFQAMALAICGTEPSYPNDLNPTAQRLIKGLLHKDPGQRFGATELDSHQFFLATPWLSVFNGSLPPPFVPPAQDVTSYLSPLDTPQSGAPYTHDPYPQFHFVSPDLEQVMVSSQERSLEPVPVNPHRAFDMAFGIHLLQNTSVTGNVAPPQEAKPKDATSSSTNFDLAYIERMRNLDKPILESESSLGTIAPLASGNTLVDGDLQDFKVSDSSTVSQPEHPRPVQEPNVAPKKRWDLIRNGWSKFQYRAQRAFRQGSRR